MRESQERLERWLLLPESQEQAGERGVGLRRRRLKVGLGGESGGEAPGEGTSPCISGIISIGTCGVRLKCFAKKREKWVDGKNVLVRFLADWPHLYRAAPRAAGNKNLQGGDIT